jgi:Domain of unknown function (DUF4365)
LAAARDVDEPASRNVRPSVNLRAKDKEQVADRTEAQILGSQGESLVAHIINSSGDWIARAQNEDFGVDVEAELAVPKVGGLLVKIQVKASRTVEIADKGVACQIPKKLAAYAESCRLPVVLVRVSIEEQRAWYVWLQRWLLDRQHIGLRTEDMPQSVTHHIPLDSTLQAGLEGELRDIAQWRTRTQLVLTVNDAIRTSAAVYDYPVLNRLVALLDALGIVNEHFPINLVIDQAVALGPELRATDEGNQASSTLYAICHHFGRTFSADQVWRMVTRDEGLSRTGVNALGVLYDEAYDHIATLGLVPFFLAHSDKRIAFYCQLRESRPKAAFLECVQSGLDVQFAGLAIHPSLKEDLLSKWPNRGDSILLDYLLIVDSPDNLPNVPDNSGG